MRQRIEERSSYRRLNCRISLPSEVDVQAAFAVNDNKTPRQVIAVVWRHDHESIGAAGFPFQSAEGVVFNKDLLSVHSQG